MTPGPISAEEVAAYALAKPGAYADEPWEGDRVAKVAEKIFVFGLGGSGVGVKCGANRADADEWLHQYPDDAAVMPYIGRNGWNTLTIGGAIPDAEILEAIDASYDLVVSKLPKSKRPSGD
ncbi:MAG: MmcQ/YjbR family DNA-binding protein [Tetrasphaera sp.]|jgi:predicted DNA-binding protein (MmcQ/YjbR family)|nr:MmcQ/YjbR family DNA-binding protein [Tetrasphaera sp.]